MSSKMVYPSDERLLDLILTALQDLVEYDLAVILRLHDGNRLVVEKALGPLVNADIGNYQIDLSSRRDIAQIISHDEPYLFDEDEVHEDTYEEILELPEGHSCLVAPLHFQDTPMGLLTLDHRACGMFTPGIVKFIGTLARLIAVIIAQDENNRTFASIRRNLTRERNLLLKANSSDFADIIGASRPWEIVLEQLRTVGGSELPVLIHGETGTGKEQVAGTIHKISHRSDKPFITLNCSALQASLAESELFGHEKGAFTSAVTQRKGRFELADGGTLFLDEIADLPSEIQPKLLRTLQEGTFERVGGEKTLHSDVRIIAASNKDLRQEIAAGRFREDLYYRLAVFPIFLPALRERREDVLLLAEHFMSELRKKEYYADLTLGNDAVDCLLDHHWPGNVRELQNVIHRAALVAGGKQIRKAHLGLRDARYQAGGEVGGTLALPAVELNRGNFLRMADMEADYIRKALSVCNGKIYGEDGAASLLDMKPTTLQSRMKKFGIS